MEVITLDQLMEFVAYILKINQHLQLSQICIESNSFTCTCHMNQYANLNVYASCRAPFALSLSLSLYLSPSCVPVRLPICPPVIQPLSQPPTWPTWRSIPFRTAQSDSWHFGIFNYLPIHQRVGLKSILFVCLCYVQTI